MATALHKTVLATQFSPISARGRKVTDVLCKECGAEGVAAMGIMAYMET